MNWAESTRRASDLDDEEPPGGRNQGPLLRIPGATGHRERHRLQRHSPQRDRTRTARRRLGRRRGRGRQRPQHREPRAKGFPGSALLIGLAVLVLLVLLLWVDAATAPQAPRGRVRRGAADGSRRPERAGLGPIDALDDLSKSMVVDVDNAVRTSDNELALAVEEFGDKETTPFSQAVANAKTTLAQAFNVRQILDDAVPETP